MNKHDFKLPDGWERHILEDSTSGYCRRTINGNSLYARYAPKNLRNNTICIYATKTRFYIAQHGWANTLVRAELKAGPFDSFQLAYVTLKVGGYESN
jgi:hypothetical protein